jgi:uncharacterized protein YcfJ
MKRTTTTVLALALTAALGSSFASAQQYGNGPGRHDNDYRNGDDRRGAEGVRTDVAQVTRVVRYSDPYRSFQREQCWNEQSRRYDDDYYRDENGRLYRDDGRNNNTGIVVGAIVGGALGHQVGNGDGRRAATIAGAVIGGAVGHNIDRNDGDHEYRGNDGIVRRCRTVEGMGNRHRRDGFEVTYRYAGQSYQAYMQRHPGRTIRVLVDVSPLENEVGIRR